MYNIFGSIEKGSDSVSEHRAHTSSLGYVGVNAPARTEDPDNQMNDIAKGKVSTVSPPHGYLPGVTMTQ